MPNSQSPNSNKFDYCIWELHCTLLPRVGVSMDRFGSGLCSTQKRPDLVGWQGGKPVTDREKSQVKSDQAWVHSGWIQFQPKDRSKTTNFTNLKKQIYTIEHIYKPKHQYPHKSKHK